MDQALFKDRDEPQGDGAMSHLSHSRISRYLLCPHQYRLYYVERLRPRVPSSSLVFGNIMHQALAEHLARARDPVACFEGLWGFLETVPLSYGDRESWSKLNAIGGSQ